MVVHYERKAEVGQLLKPSRRTLHALPWMIYRVESQSE